MRIGTKNRPFYRIVAVDDRKKRTGGYLDLIGTYNPLTTPKEIKIDQEKVDAWVKKGAQLSHGYLRIIGQAAQKPPRKPRNDKGTSAAPEAPAAAPAAEATKEEESAVEAAEPEVATDETAVDDAVVSDVVEAEVTPEETVSEEVTEPEKEGKADA